MLRLIDFRNELPHRRAVRYPFGQVLSALSSSPQRGEVFSRRKITAKEKCLLYRAPKEIALAIKKGEFVFAFDDKELLGGIGQKPVGKNWQTFFCFFVLPGYRGQGIGGKLLNEVVAVNKQSFLFAVSANQTVEKKLMNLGFAKVPFLKLPLPISLSFLKARFLSPNIIRNLKLFKQKTSFFIRSPQSF